MIFEFDDQALFWLLIGIVLILRRTPLRKPFLWQETFWHELSHGIACGFTGGRIRRIQLLWNGAGNCTTQGGNRTLILLSGYLGAALWGGLIYFAGWSYSNTAASVALYSILGIFGISTLLFVRDFKTLLIIVIMAGAMWLPLKFDVVKVWPIYLQFVGLYVCISAIQAPLHLFDGEDHGDGAELAKLWFFPEFIWIFAWVAAAIFVLYNLWQLNP